MAEPLPRDLDPLGQEGPELPGHDPTRLCIALVSTPPSTYDLRWFLKPGTSESVAAKCSLNAYSGRELIPRTLLGDSGHEPARRLLAHRAESEPPPVG